MKKEIKKYLFDIMSSAEEINSYTNNFTFTDYSSNKLVQRAVERNFEIIGEALNAIKYNYSDLINKISDYQRIIGFRNILIHGYSEIDEKIVWDAIQKHLPILIKEISPHL